MGVKLQEIIVSRPIDLHDLQGRIMAIDGPNIVSALFNFTRKKSNQASTDQIIDRTQRVISHLYGLLYRVNFYYSKGIFPIFCFDGRDSQLKRFISKDLLKDFIYTDKRYREAMKKGDRDLARNIALGKEYKWPNIIRESKLLLGAIGVPVIESPASAESQCAQLVKFGNADLSNSQDYDSLLFGCPITIQNLSKSHRRKQHGRWVYERIEPKVIHLKDNLAIWGISQFQLIDLGILVGNDYFSGIPKIGSKTALSLIKKHGNLESIIQAERDHYNFSQLTSEILKEVRKIFLFPEVLENLSGLYWNVPDKSRIVHLLCKDHHLNEERVRNNIEKLSKNYLKCLKVFKTGHKNQLSIQKTLDAMF